MMLYFIGEIWSTVKIKAGPTNMKGVTLVFQDPVRERSVGENLGNIDLIVSFRPIIV